MNHSSSRCSLEILRTFAFCLSVLALINCASSDPSPALAGAKAADNDFMTQYDTARTRAIQEVPLAFLAMPQTLLVIRHGQVTESLTSITPTYTVLKDVSHVILGLYVASWHLPAPKVALALTAYAPYVDAVESSLTQAAIPERHMVRQRKLLAAAHELIQRASSKNGLSQEWLDVWARQRGPSLLKNSREAARSQLELINHEMTAQIQAMTPKEKNSFIVIVSGAHQARDENLWMQYLGRLLGPQAISGERRRVYAESVYDTQGALDLLGSHVMDRSIGEAFFASPERMQRDILGDAAEKIIPTLDIPQLSP